MEASYPDRGAGLIGPTPLTGRRLCARTAYDTRAGRAEKLKCPKDPHQAFDIGGDILQTTFWTKPSMARTAFYSMRWAPSVPISARVRRMCGNLQCHGSLREGGRKRLVYSSSASVYGDAVAEPMDRIIRSITRTYGATKIAVKRYPCLPPSLRLDWRGSQVHERLRSAAG